MSVIAEVATSLARPEERLTAGQLRELLEQLGKGDYETAHGVADELMEKALRQIAEGHADPETLARDVLIVVSADFPRYCA